MSLTIRVGLSNPNGRMPIEMENRDLPVLISANSLFDHKRHCFREVPCNLDNVDTALDSAGFVAMARYGRYPWTIAQYVELAMGYSFRWWSQMDCCCEPEVAGDRETVKARVIATAQMLYLCNAQFYTWLEQAPELKPMTSPPMPIVQGWLPEDYEYSATLADHVLQGEWPAMIGVGSVCRRQLTGPHGLWRVLERLDSVLPKHVTLHLFGVKGSAIEGLHEHPRVASIDSMAFEFRARMAAREQKVSKTIDFRLKALDGWVEAQRESAIPSSQLRLAM